MIDGYKRKIDYVRVSVTDRCNFRCIYCMPEDGVNYKRHEEILSFEEIIRVIKILANLGVTKVKITGGEPLVRKDLSILIRKIKAIDGIKSVTLTTNGELLEKYIDDLEKAGLDGINISLDALDEMTFNKLTRRNSFHKVMKGIEVACQSSINNIKINFVPIKNLNSEQIIPLINFAVKHNIIVRFIELMPLGYGKKYEAFEIQEVRALLEREIGTLILDKEAYGNGPAEYFSIEGLDIKIGFINAISNKFCTSCNRIRLTSEGFLKTCLHFNEGIMLRDDLRQGKDDLFLRETIEQAISNKQKEHQFYKEEVAHIEDKKMFQIGG